MFDVTGRLTQPTEGTARSSLVSLVPETAFENAAHL